MNNGLYANSSGRTGKKIAGFVGKNTGTQTNIFITNAAGLPSLVTSVSVGVRTRLASINSNGAVLYAGVGNSSGTGIITAELVIDGEVVSKSISGTISTFADGVLVAGYASYNSADVAPVPIQTIFDYIPFDSTAELWVTTTGTLTSVKYIFLAELHK